ncbi:MAG: M23 family metallopeptidase [Planctomycetota bacterium]
MRHSVAALGVVCLSSFSFRISSASQEPSLPKPISGVVRSAHPRGPGELPFVLESGGERFRLTVNGRDDGSAVRQGLSLLRGQLIALRAEPREDGRVWSFDGVADITPLLPVDLSGALRAEAEGLVLEGRHETFTIDSGNEDQLRPFVGRKVDMRCRVEGERVTAVFGVREHVGSRFVFPCETYLKGRREGGGFGALVSRRASPVFAGSHHLGEDIWLPWRTPVRSIAAGRVVYSDFSPSWRDDRGQMHWNLGNVVVIEHELEEPIAGLDTVCSVSIHLAADRRVRLGDRVHRGQLIGFLGEDRSEENGRYPAHLHFGIHQGPWVQISPAWSRSVRKDAETSGLPVEQQGTVTWKTGRVESIEMLNRRAAIVRFEGSRDFSVLSLLTGSTSPEYRPDDIMGWCHGYGDADAVNEWLEPSAWLEAHRTTLDAR